MAKKGMIQRAFSFFGKGGVAKKAPPRLAEYQREKSKRFDIRDDKRYIIDSSEFSRQDFKFLELRAPELTRLGIDGARILPHFRELQVDGWEWFYRGAPRTKERGEYYADFNPHDTVLSLMGGMAEYRSLRGKTIRNKLTSLIATKKLNDILNSLPEQVVRSIASAQQSGEDARQAGKRLKTFRRMWEEADEAGNEEKKQQLEAMGHELAELEEDSREEAEANAQKAAEAMRDNEDEIRDALRQCLSEAEEAAAATQATMDTLSFGRGPGVSRKLNEEMLIEMSEQIENDQNLQDIAKLAGRIKQIIARKSQQRDRTDYGEVIDTELGSDVSRMVGPELAMLADEDLGLDLVRRLYDEQATVWTKESQESLGRGPIVCAVDCSGSMGGKRICWAKAIACALYRVCKERKQPFKMIQYSGSVYAKTFSHGGEDDAEFMKMLQHFEGGGTYYETAWAEIIKTFDEEREMAKADVVFISDEMFPVGQFPNELRRFNEALVDARAKCFGISVTGRRKYYGESENSVVGAFQHFCHSSWGINPHLDNDNDQACIEELFVGNLEA
tara:strand:- start:2377 stop:4053 length:1677 start_codon:yes stop_codon:yes gene_type:complete